MNKNTEQVLNTKKKKKKKAKWLYTRKPHPMYIKNLVSFSNTDGKKLERYNHDIEHH